MPATAAKVVGISSGVATFGTTGSIVRRLLGVTDANAKSISKEEMTAAVGWLGPSPISALTQKSAELNFDMTATYEELPKLLNMFFAALATGVGAAAPYTYTWPAPINSTQTIDMYTAEYGTTGASYRLNGVVGNDLTLKGEAGGLWQASVAAIAKELVPSTSGLSTTAMSSGGYPLVHPVRMADTTLYIDAFSTGTIGSSAQTATLISFELGVKTGRHVKFFAGGETPGAWGEGRMDGTLKVTAEFNANAKAMVDEMLGTTGAVVKRQMRIKALENSGSSERYAQVDFAGVKTGGEQLFGDRDGNLTVDLTFSGSISTALGNWLQLAVENGSSSTT